MIHQKIIQFGTCFPYVVTSHVKYLKLYTFWRPIIYIEHGKNGL